MPKLPINIEIVSTYLENAMAGVASLGVSQVTLTHPLTAMIKPLGWSILAATLQRKWKLGA